MSLPEHVVLIPSFNTGDKLFDTIADVRNLGLPVIVAIDGSTDGTSDKLVRLADEDPALTCCILPNNQGKGAAILQGLRLAQREGFTHVLTMDADGQHSIPHVHEMIAISIAHPGAMVLGVPLFDESAPRIRILGHKIANFCTSLLTPRGAIADSLFGFRVYPVAPLIGVFDSTSGMRRFDFDSEAVIRLLWTGVPAINVPTPVRYFRRREGGVSHFNYPRDNLLLAVMYVRLLAAYVARRVAQRFKSSRH